MTADAGDTEGARDQHVASPATTSPSPSTTAAAAETRPITVADSSPDPPLPYDEEPPLPDGPAPNDADDGWEAKWDDNAQAWYFYNHRSGVSQWENPRVPEATAHSHQQLPSSSSTGLHPTSGAPGTSSPPKRIWGGYNPAIHGSYDPNADYAKEAMREQETEAEANSATTRIQHPNNTGYASQAQFNRFTGKFQQAGVGPELHNDENKSKRQMAAFFDVDAAANSHDGRSLKAERRGKTLTKKELHAFKEKRHKKKEEKRRAFYRD